jgi:hypothetical protein
MRQARAPTASDLQNPPPPPSSTKASRLFGKALLGEDDFLSAPSPFAPAGSSPSSFGRSSNLMASRSVKKTCWHSSAGIVARGGC